MCSAKAILGFVRFTRYYYIVVANEIKPEGVIMGHIVYSITVSLPDPASRLELRRHSALCEEFREELPPQHHVLQERLRRARRSFISSVGAGREGAGAVHHDRPDARFLLLLRLPLSFCVQHNVMVVSQGMDLTEQSMFVWNAYLLSEFASLVAPAWFVSITNGVFLQQRCVDHGKPFQLTLVARRSRWAWGRRMTAESTRARGT